MLVRLETAREGPIAWEETLDISAETLYQPSLDQPSLVELSPVEASGRLEWTDPDFLLTVGLRYRQRLACDRCLQEFWNDVSSDAQLLVVRSTAQVDSAERELAQDDLGVIAVTDDELDSQPLIEEQIALNLPMKPLCSPTCRGLCARCGSDLNQGPCDCPVEVDPRFGPLAALRDQLRTEDNEEHADD
jgi:uncharacterized protein